MANKGGLVRGRIFLCKKGAALIEPLEPRAMLAATYTLLDMNALIPETTGDNFQAANITATGLVAFNNTSLASNSGNVGYVYSIPRGRVYQAPNGDGVTQVANNGSLLLGDTIDLDGQLHTVPTPTSTSSDEYFLDLTSINDTGQVARRLEFFYVPEIQNGGYETSQSEVFNPDGTTLVTLPLPGFYTPTIAPVLDDLGELVTYSTANQSTQVVAYDHATVYNLKTKKSIDIGALFAPGILVTATDIDDNGIVVGSYQKSHVQNGVFSYNIATKSLSLIPTGVAVATNVNVNADGLLVGSLQTSRQHGRTRDPSTEAVIFNTAHGVRDLASFASTPAGVVLTNALGADSDGDILANGIDAEGVPHAYLLKPNG